MAMIRMPKSPYDDLPTFADPTQMVPPDPSQPPPPTNWSLHTTPTGAIPVPTSPTSQAPTQWPTSAPTTTSAPSADDWDNNWTNYWAPDRREKLLSLLERDYHAPDKQQRIDWLKNLSDAELWPHGKPGSQTPTTPAPPTTPPWQTPPSMPAPPGFDQGKWGNVEHQTDKYKIGRMLAAGLSIDEILKQMPGWTKVSQDTVMAPDGSLFDLYYDYGGPQQRIQFTYVGGGPGSGTPPPPRPPTPPGQTTAPIPPMPAPQSPTTPNLNAPTTPTPTTPNPLVTPQQSGPIPTISWAPGTAFDWQKDPTSQATYAQVANALSRALGRAPTPEEVWAHLNYNQRPDKNFLQQIVNHILDTVKPDPATQQQPGQQPTDPYLDEYQKYLDEYLKSLASQRSRWEQDNETFRQRQQQAQQSTERLIKFLEERSKKLLQPAYTGAEGEVFRTQALDPIENDRSAAKQRALQRISQRGLDPNSGIAQDLLNQVDLAFDKSRATTQNELAYHQITEQRSREQEAQDLLGMIPSIQDAAVRGDVDFLNLLDQQIRNTYREGMDPVQRKYNIPNDALQQALAALGLGTDPMQLLQMLMQQQQYSQSNSNALWGSLGSMLPYILNLYSRGNTRMPANWTGGT